MDPTDPMDVASAVAALSVQGSDDGALRGGDGTLFVDYPSCCDSDREHEDCVLASHFLLGMLNPPPNKKGMGPFGGTAGALLEGATPALHCTSIWIAYLLQETVRCLLCIEN